MQPGLNEGAHKGRMHMPKGRVLDKGQNQDRAPRISKHFIDCPGHLSELDDLKTLEQAWVRYLRVTTRFGSETEQT